MRTVVERLGRLDVVVNNAGGAPPADIADAWIYFASPLSAYVTGANLVLHGSGDRPALLAAR